MAKPSVYKQIDAVQVIGPYLMPSPRHWNCGLLKYKGRLWMCYRYHLTPEHASRCATAMVPLNSKTFQPTAPSQHLNFPAHVGDEHFEDARLFMFDGEPHISFTEMNSYRPGVDYRCVIKYAQLKLVGSSWSIVRVYHPKYGQNNGAAREKNWAFFEHAKKLHAVYCDGPVRRVIQLNGEKVVHEYLSDGPVWPWGTIRGGTAPIPYGEDQMLAIFHSSLPTEQSPHFVRYYAGAYIFDAKPPFTVRAISEKPLISGSEEDGHGYDPRCSEGWKPFIPFPCGLVRASPIDESAGWLVSLGVNDWQCGVGKILPSQLKMVSPDGSDRVVRYFHIPNGSLPVHYISKDRQVMWLRWHTPPPSGRSIRVSDGYFATSDGREAEVVAEAPNTTEITAEQYVRAMKVPA